MAAQRPSHVSAYDERMQLDPGLDRLVHRVAGAEAAALVEAGVTVLDVRTEGEFTGLGHIPNATLLPVNLIACAPAVLADDAAPVLVCCEHAVRSRVAARLLTQAGFTRVYELADGMASWMGPRTFTEAPIAGPSWWLLLNADLLPASGRALDVACGKGRHALLLAAAGLDVTAIDRDVAALERLQTQAARLGLTITTEAVDLEDPAWASREMAWSAERYALILTTRYLHRPLFPRLTAALAPRGTLLYETFLEAQAARGRPTNPDFLLRPGELAQLVQPLEVLRAHEGEVDGAMVAAVAARCVAAPRSVDIR
jgi:rhodanese-related sulfurtransferase